MSKIIGIDLGTTNSGVALVQDGQPVMLPHGRERIIPSVVGYTSGGQWLVGTPARNQYVLDPENTVVSIKRKMGQDYRVTLGGNTFTPPEISAFILRELKEIAERNLGQPVTEAVITVPAYFSDGQRQATKDAGRIAGLNVRRIINEPTAAALAYGLNLQEDQMALVYDLGGGTFDVSLVEMMGGVVEVRASHGNTQLGGDDFDQRLAEMLADWFAEEHGVDVRQERRAWARLIRAAEQAKIALSDHPYTWIKEAYLVEKEGVPLHLEYELSREDFVSLITDLLEETLESIDQVLSDGQVGKEEVDQVLLVGGSTRIPAVWEIVAGHVGIEPQVAINPDEAVALGAAVQAAIIAGDPIDTILVDVTPHSLGIAVAERTFMGDIVTDRYKPLIHRNSTIPVSKEDRFFALHPDQDMIKIQVYQGEKPVASHNTFLGDFSITGLKAVIPGETPEITVQFDLDLNGMLQVRARDRASGQIKEIQVEATVGRLGDAAVEEAQDRLAAATVTPLPPSVQALVNRGEQLLASDDLDEEGHIELSTLLGDIRAAQRDDDLHRLDDLSDTLLEFLFDYEE
ncbi:MAG: Hsp70 family protein [Anaerolineae bacterium]|nr:Hsp70 family protein [Anaerolineae bacterium]